MINASINSNNINNDYWKLIEWGTKEYYLDIRTNLVYIEDFDDLLEIGTWSNGKIVRH